MNDDMVDTERIRLEHSLPCNVAMCDSKLMILRSALVYYPALRNMLFNMYHARKCHSTISTIDDVLQSTNPLVILTCNRVWKLVDDDAELPLGDKCIQGIGEALIDGGL